MTTVKKSTRKVDRNYDLIRFFHGTMGEVTVKCTTVLVDLTLLTGGIILIATFMFGVSPSRRGFFCEDDSIRYDYRKSTISDLNLIISCLILPPVLITLIECRLQRNRGSGTFLACRVPLWIISAYRSVIDFLFGFAAVQLATEIGKRSIGRLRPHFIDVCGPDIDLSNCNQYGQKYIENYKCVKASKDDAKEARLSFPSGHSSVSAFAMLYVAIFIQVKWCASGSALRLLKSGVQLSLMLFAYFTALSRVMDNKHHWSDITAGALLGVVSASITARYVSGLVGSCKQQQNEEGATESLTLESGPRSDVEAGLESNEQSYDVVPPKDEQKNEEAIN